MVRIINFDDRVLYYQSFYYRQSEYGRDHDILQAFFTNASRASRLQLSLNGVNVVVNGHYT